MPSKEIKATLPCDLAEITFKAISPLFKYKFLNEHKISTESHQGNTLSVPRTPCVPTILPACKNNYFILSPENKRRNLLRRSN